MLVLGHQEQIQKQANSEIELTSLMKFSIFCIEYA